MQWGYIVFVFSVCLSVCLHLFCVKDISGTTLPRNLKFCTHDKYDQLYCGKENKGHEARFLRVISLCCSLPGGISEHMLTSWSSVSMT